MKFTTVLLLALVATAYVVKAQDDDDDVDVEVMDDEDVEIEDDDDVLVEDDDDLEDDDGDDDIDIGQVEEEQPQLMPMPLPGVKSFIHFPDGAHTITGGKVSEIIVGIQNEGDDDIEMVSCNGRMHYPQQQNEVVQNFTNVGYDKQQIASKSEASFFYAFMPNIYTGGREFIIAIEIYYKVVGTNQFYRAVPFNETVSILESTEGVATEIFFLWSTVVAVAIAASFYFYKKVMVKKLGLGKSSSAGAKKIERGTSNEGVNLDWVEQHHIRKRNVSNKSK